MATTVYVLNGPNLNLLGTREPKTYGHATLGDVETLCREVAGRRKLAIEFRQSNHEGEIVDSIHEAGAKKAAGIVINAGAYTHTSLAIRDAIAAFGSGGEIELDAPATPEAIFTAVQRVRKSRRRNDDG